MFWPTRDTRAKQRLSESMGDNKAMSAELLAAGLITDEAHAETARISDGAALKLGAGIVDPETGEIIETGEHPAGDSPLIATLPDDAQTGRLVTEAPLDSGAGAAESPSEDGRPVNSSPAPTDAGGVEPDVDTPSVAGNNYDDEVTAETIEAMNAVVSDGEFSAFDPLPSADPAGTADGGPLRPSAEEVAGANPRKGPPAPSAIPVSDQPPDIPAFLRRDFKS